MHMCCPLLACNIYTCDGRILNHLRILSCRDRHGCIMVTIWSPELIGAFLARSGSVQRIHTGLFLTQISYQGFGHTTEQTVLVKCMLVTNFRHIQWHFG